MGRQAMVACADCGRPYETFDLDVVVPDEQWRDICPTPPSGDSDGGILCGACVICRGSKLPGVVVARLHFEFRGVRAGLAV